MGKRIIKQRRGRGSPTYRSNSHRHKAQIKHRVYDEIEKKEVIKGKITNLINCPGHSAPLMEVTYPKEKIFLSAPENIKVSDEVESGFNAKVKPGNSLPLKNIPTGTLIYNIENKPGDGGKFCRSSGTFARVVSFLDNFVIIKFPSKKEKKVNLNCRAVIGVVAGAGRKEKPIVKAGKNWHIMHAKGRLYPRTSGVAMNAVDHPFGSGRGRQHAKVKIAKKTAHAGRRVGKLRSRRTGKKR